MPPDRRVVRTRTALYDALVALIRCKDYDKITVEDILQEADVGRATFYAHFTSKDHLLERSLDRLRDQLTAAVNKKDGSTVSQVLFEHVSEYRDIPAALSGGRGAAIVRQAVDKVLTEQLRPLMPKQGFHDDIPRQLAIMHIVSTFNTVHSWWLDHNPGLSPADAHALFRRLLLQPGPAKMREGHLADII